MEKEFLFNRKPKRNVHPAGIQRLYGPRFSTSQHNFRSTGDNLFDTVKGNSSVVGTDTDTTSAHSGDRD